MKISVALCTYNGQKFITEQLNSILNQSTSVDEIIICDDGSKDKTPEIINNFVSKHPGLITFYINKINLKVNKNFEKAIFLCTGDYIFLCDQDDVWKSNKVEKMMEHFSKNTLAEAVFSNAELINENGQSFTEHNLWSSILFMESELKKPIDLYSYLIFKSNMVTGATLCIKKEIKDIILPIPDIKGYFHDEWIATVIAARKTLDYTTDWLISYRIHCNQQIGVGESIKNSKVNDDNIKKYLLFTNNILGDVAPKTYMNYKRLSNNYFRNYLKYKMLSSTEYNKHSIYFSELSNKNLDLFKHCEIQLKKINPFFYFIRKKVDKLKGKRQIIK